MARTPHEIEDALESLNDGIFIGSLTPGMLFFIFSKSIKFPWDYRTPISEKKSWGHSGQFSFILGRNRAK
jgi:hypothetical protein